jgi:serine protein kinase
MNSSTREARRFLSDVGGKVHERFVASKSLLSFEEYLDLYLREPRRQARSAAQYLRDAMDFYGSDERETPVGKVRRWRLFDGLFDRPDGPSEGRVAGQEEVQAAIYRQVSNFVRAGRVNRLILLHGPNGSAKTSIITALQRALEDYSHRDEGARSVFTGSSRARSW